MKLKSILPYKHYLIMLIGVIVSVGILFLPLGSEEFPLYVFISSNFMNKKPRNM